jgi:hypothetical protein
LPPPRRLPAPSNHSAAIGGPLYAQSNGSSQVTCARLVVASIDRKRPTLF